MICIENLCKSYDSKKLFDNFCIEIKDGEFIVFYGDSGCGKTTLLNLIGGLEAPDKGYVKVDGTDISKKKNKRDYFKNKVGFLFQNFALIENKTVRQNLEIVPKKSRTEKSLEGVLSEVGLLEKMDTKVYKLSGGEQQRVALARLMVKKCDIILADEPTGSLDSRNAEEVMKILHKLNEQGKTIIIVSHNEKIIVSEKRAVKLG